MQIKKLVSMPSRTGRDLQRYNFEGCRQVVGCVFILFLFFWCNLKLNLAGKMEMKKIFMWDLKFWVKYLWDFISWSGLSKELGKFWNLLRNLSPFWIFYDQVVFNFLWLERKLMGKGRRETWYCFSNSFFSKSWLWCFCIVSIILLWSDNLQMHSI